MVSKELIAASTKRLVLAVLSRGESYGYDAERASEVKLKHFEMETFFRFCGYGDHHASRNDVAALALERGCLSQVAPRAMRMYASVHLPQLSFNGSDQNWSTTLDIVKDSVGRCWVPIYIYLSPVDVLGEMFAGFVQRQASPEY